MLKEWRCDNCKRLLARVGEHTELQIKCSRCGAFNHVRAKSPEPLTIACERPRQSDSIGKK